MFTFGAMISLCRPDGALKRKDLQASVWLSWSRRFQYLDPICHKRQQTDDGRLAGVRFSVIGHFFPFVHFELLRVKGFAVHANFAMVMLFVLI